MACFSAIIVHCMSHSDLEIIYNTADSGAMQYTTIPIHVIRNA